MREYFFISDEDYEIAARNGITKRQVYQRVYASRWPVEKAITTPIYKPEVSWNDWKDKCPVTRETFFLRLKRGMTPEQAVSQKEFPRKIDRKHPPISEEVYEAAENIGVSRKTVYARIIIYKWPIEKAMTTPMLSKSEAAQCRKGGWK